MRISSAALFAALLASSLSRTALSATSTSPAKGVLPFMADDYPGARAAARAQSKPIFLEAWAPW
jgi:hypothetical protein